MSERPENEGIEIELVDSEAGGNPQEAPAEEQVSTLRLVATLAVAGALAGLLIVLVNLHTKPIIDEYRAEQLRLAVYEVLPGVAVYRTLYRDGDALLDEIPAGAMAGDAARLARLEGLEAHARAAEFRIPGEIASR